MGSGATILVADPQADVLQLVEAMLAHRSYNVLTAATGAEAAQKLDGNAHVHLLLSEVALPDVSGVELARRVRRTHPSTAVMLMTAFTDHTIDADIPLMVKPFTAASLASQVEAVLADSADAGRRHRTLRAGWQRTMQDSQQLMAEFRDTILQAQNNILRSRERREATRAATVMVVDDDPVWRYVASRHLARAGITVLEACCGAEALAICEAHRIDMLITNVRTPGMDGVALAESLVKAFPKLAVLFVNGSDEGLPHPSMRKPCDPEDVLAAVKWRLARR
ncbi:MAG: response regulator [Acidobacteria bacterium]|nr:response regulator [Acidobacteriota bacterium]